MFNIKSPDGFNISMEDFKTEAEAWAYFEVWKARFEHQGYYSMASRQRIKLADLKDWCDLVEYS